MGDHEVLSFPDHGESGLHPGALLELVVAELRRRIDADATVAQGVTLMGLNEIPRRCDVVIRRSLGAREHLTIVECKDRTRPVGVEFVDVLATVRADIGADLAILVSPSGFTKNARLQAASKGILLQSLRGATADDWKRLFGRPTMIPFAMVVANDIRCGAVPLDNSAAIPIPPGAVIVHGPTGKWSTAKALFDDAWPSIQPVPELGWIVVTLDLVDGSTLITESGVAIRVMAIEFAVEGKAVQYSLDARLFGGAMLEDVNGGTLNYGYLATLPLDWREALVGKTPRSLTNEEYARMRKGMIAGTHPTFDPRKLKQHLRVRVELVSGPLPGCGSVDAGLEQFPGTVSAQQQISNEE